MPNADNPVPKIPATPVATVPNPITFAPKVAVIAPVNVAAKLVIPDPSILPTCTGSEVNPALGFSCCQLTIPAYIGSFINSSLYLRPSSNAFSAYASNLSAVSSYPNLSNPKLNASLPYANAFLVKSLYEVDIP